MGSLTQDVGSALHLFPEISFASYVRSLQVNAASSNAPRRLPLDMFVQLHSLKLSDTHLRYLDPEGLFPLASRACCI